ncbi:DUF2268 domain-containing protein [Peribacillus huizhouensis]|uniref:Uncharacterized protein YjaZ n=1 Tax=Peribacillus huizhouensis TaxID=1501239 RepID=A0ABR6CJF2_9BACI|nr:DUF2268 domain-containing protein [Peribacillus huizhouensis]MBA9025193.1 uncharacterized protein YjaZ [Peribacillus huizhouensis]
MMGIVETNRWLMDNNNPIEICKQLAKEFPKMSPNHIYQMLLQHGMYRDPSQAKKDAEVLVSDDIWREMKVIYQRFQRLWQGPDIPIYIFPMNAGGLFNRVTDKKSGLAFRNHIFLFVRPDISLKELTAVFIHEYHHVCRIAAVKKHENDFTLLDRMVMEGLAEHAVMTYLGKDYLANWTDLYSDEQLQLFWKKYLKENIHLKRIERKHDQLLLGKSPYPKMLGYTAGYFLVRQKKDLTVKKTFAISSEDFKLKE